jgi:amino acid adenylation domain-containing protein
VDVTHWTVDDSVAIGRPVWNTQVYVLDRFLQPVPPGVAGELYLGGVQLARGYLNRAALTASRFVANPFTPGERLYRTGDLVRWRDDGVLDFLGRADDQVKIRGFRVELGEIEAALTALPGIEAAAVIAQAERQQLIGYVVGESADVKRRLGKSLPEHLVPSVIVELDALPLTPSGKLDRKALPEAEVTPTSAEPGTERERVLARLFADLLGIDRVGVHDDFFALGGHSLLATKLVGRIRAELGAELAISAVFDAPTVARLAVVLDDGGQKRPALTPMPRPRRVPLSFAQQRLWFLYRLEGPSPTYNVPLAVRLDGPVDLDALRAALSDVVSRHEVLRTVYPEFEGKPYQQVLEWAPTLHTGGTLREAAHRAFELDREPPFEARLVDGQVLSLLTHHIASDGWSADRLLADLTTAYTARLRGRRPDWTPLPVQYADYALWQRDLLGNAADPDSLSATQLAYWTGQLAELPDELALPADRPRPTTPSFEGDAVRFSLSPETHAALSALAREAGATVFMTVHAALAALLNHLGAGEDISLGTPVACRTDDALDGLVGFFVNTLVLRTDVSGNPTFRQLVERVRRTDLDAFAHQDLPFERLVEVVNPARSMGRHPLFQVVLAYQQGPGEAVPFGAASRREEHVDFYAARMDLSFHLFEQRNGLDGWLVYSKDLFDQSTVDDLVRRFVRLVETLVAEPDQPLARTTVLTEAEREMRFDDHPIPETTLPALIEAQVARTPDATAVIFEDERLTYAELDARSTDLAERLAAAGVGPEAIVGIRQDRSLDLIVSLLAVLKAGGAYLPLDSSYPAERLDFMISDAQPVAVLPAAFVGKQRITQPRPDNPAYVIYTSGSTGRPKGVVISHRAIVNRLLWMQHQYRLTDQDRVLQKTPTSFDVSVWECFWPLTSGAVLVMARPGGHKDPDYSAEVIAREGVTTVHFVPSMLRAYGDRPLPERVICSGEALPADLARSGMHNLYGPTEAAVDVTHWTVEDSVAIGRPVWNTQVYVLDRYLRPVAPGVMGELYLGGVQLARGYASRRGLTAARFVANPFTPGERLYRTGDLVKRTADGVLHYLGRTDEQVKIRGFRVELGEIEAAVERVPGVHQAVVVARDQRLVAYVVGQADTVREQVAASLPEHMVPAAIVPLDELPLTPSGKLDRKALPEPDFTALAGDDKPRNERESLLCKLFAETLRLPEVGAHDSFFELGGDSIVSVQLVSRARKAGISVTPRQVFEHRTPAGLAAVAGEFTARADVAHGRVEPTPIMRYRGLVQAMLLVAPDGLTEDDLLRTLQAVLDRHDMLCARWAGDHLFVPKESFPAKEILTRATGSLDDELLAARDRLSPERMLQVVWFEDRVLIVADHLVVDGVSWRILSEDLAEAWQGRELPRTGTSFRRWSELLGQQDRSGEWELWRSILDGADPVLPLTIGEPKVTEFTAPVPEGDVQQALLSAFGAALTRWRPARDAVIAVEGHGREEQIAPGVDLSTTVGWFTTVFPLRLNGTMNALPDHGLGYGLLRPLGLPEPTIVVNYLGRVELGDGSPWSVAPEAPMLRVPPRDGRRADWALEVNAAAIGAELRISLTSLEDVDELAELLHAALVHVKPALALSLVDISSAEIAEFEEEPDTW